MAEAVVGAKALDATLKRMRTTAAKRAMSRGLRKSGQILAKRVKAEVPSRYKEIRKAIGWRSLKQKVNRGQPGVKIGAAVGKAKAPKPVDRTGRPGVGISRANVHWWFLGTSQRVTKAGASRGAMPRKMRPVAAIAATVAGELTQVMRKYTWEGIQKEIQKGKAF